MEVSTDKTQLLTEQTNSKCKSHLWKKLVILMIGIVIIISIIVIILVYTIFSQDKSSPKAGMFGLWPTYGGDLTNSQKPPNPDKVVLNHQNIKNVSIECIYESENGTAMLGYPTIDNENNSYFADASGYITCVNLDNCQQPIWRQNVATLLGFDENIRMVTHQTLTIFRDSNGNEGLLFGTPSYRGFGSNYSPELGCYALAVHKNNGSFWWTVQVGKDYKDQDYACTMHGFYVDGKYAYGGFTQSCCYNFGESENKLKFIGR
eukprot:219596_1